MKDIWERYPICNCRWPCISVACEDISFDQSIICKCHMTEQHSSYGWRCNLCRVVVSRTQAHRNCDGALKLVNRTTMTCTSKEKEMHDQFQRERDGKIMQIKMTYKQKIDIQTDNSRKSNQKENRYMRAYPRRKSRLYKSLALRYGEAKQQKDRLWTQQKRYR